MRKFVRIFDIGEIFMISDNRDRVGGSLQGMFPFGESKDNSKKFPVIDIIVTFCWQEGFGEVSARVKIPIGVLLHEYIEMQRFQ